MLVVGAGPSGIDLVNHLSQTSEHISFSQRNVGDSDEALKKSQSALAANCVVRDVVKRFTLTGAEFVDGTHETFTTVIWATGYDFAYPFLSADCGIHVDDRYVQSLYKQVINIEHPTMALIGIPAAACSTQMFDLQASVTACSAKILLTLLLHYLLNVIRTLLSGNLKVTRFSE